jgi:glycerol uptake facilitator-like aquaporin
MKSSLLAESLGSAALLAIVVGSGIMGERLGQGNTAIALLANSLATGAGLYVLITLLAPISGAHLNPLVSLVMWCRGQLAGVRVPGYVVAQVLGAIAGVWLSHAMFDLPVLQLGAKLRSGPGQWLSEVVATGGLLATIVLGTRARPTAVPVLAACYIGCAYWFTASTSFANSAVTIARALTDSFAGIRPADVAGFILAQTLAAILFLFATRLLQPAVPLVPIQPASNMEKHPHD